MNYPKLNWYDAVLDLETADKRKLYRPIKEMIAVSGPYFSSAVQTTEWSVQDRNKPLRVLVNSQHDVMDPCNETHLEELHKAAEDTKHQYFVFTKHPLSFVQKPLFHKNNIWTGVSFSGNAGLPFGAEELLQAFPNNNWIWQIDLNTWTEEQISMIKRGVKWLILDCSEHHNAIEQSSRLPCLNQLLLQVDKEKIPAFMSNRLAEIIPAPLCRRELPKELEARVNHI